MSLWNRPAPVEPSAAERVAAVVPRCDACLTPGLPDYRAPRTFDDLTTAEQSLLRPPAWLPPCRHEHGRTR